jgi:hypothetical protein
MILRVKAWNRWRKRIKNRSIFYKILVLFGIVKSPTMTCEFFIIGLEEGLKNV